MNTTETYDSKSDTLAHIERVRKLLFECVSNLSHRGQVHDASKLQEPEKSAFDACTLKLKTMPYGGPEYKAALTELGPALKHHYEANGHHPEHWTNGLDDMSLFDIVEMFIDWKASTERMANGGDIRKSLEINTDRFKISPQLKSILANTIKEMGW